MRKKYINIPIPEELAQQINLLMEESGLGYKTKSEFIKEAIIEKLIKLKNWSHLKELDENNNKNKKTIKF